jgi:EAL domain-containing protein (putative c-di-GMP-specific phosphodiesterase class I)
MNGDAVHTGLSAAPNIVRRMSTPNAAQDPFSEPESSVQQFAQRIEAALPVMFARWLSLHDERGTVHWQSGDVMGPTERDGLRAALESFTGHSAPARVNYPLAGERTAVLLRATDVFGDGTGFVILVVDNRKLRGKGLSAKDLPVPVMRAVRDWGAHLARQAFGSDSRPAIWTAAQRRDLATGPAVDDPDADRQMAKLRAFPLTLFAQRLQAIQAGTRIRRYEVYMRLAGAEELNAAPDALLRDAEQRCLGTVLDRRVLSDLVVWLRQRSDVWRSEPAQFSVNLSATTLRDPHFPQFVELCLSKAQLPAGMVAFELHQDLCRRHPQRVRHLAELIEAAGANLVIDDFSMNDDSVNLLMLPGLRLVKIARALTGEVLNTRAGQACVAGLATMARVAGIHSVAKKVDHQDEHPLLTALGVDFVQGYGNATPAPLDAIDAEREECLLIDPGVAAHA